MLIGKGRRCVTLDKDTIFSGSQRMVTADKDMNFKMTVCRRADNQHGRLEQGPTDGQENHNIFSGSARRMIRAKKGMPSDRYRRTVTTGKKQALFVRPNERSRYTRTDMSFIRALGTVSKTGNGNCTETRIAPRFFLLGASIPPSFFGQP